MTDKEEKMLKILELYPLIHDTFILKFFDLDSDKMLDEKIEVLTALKNGKVPAEIPKYYKILEKFPKDEMWDL